MATSSSDRATRIEQLRAQIKALSEELAALEREEAQDPFAQYVARVRAVGRKAIAEPQFARYFAAHERLEQEWTRRGKPTTNWEHLAVFAQVRTALDLPPIEGVGVPARAAAAATADQNPAAPVVAGAAPAATDGAIAEAPKRPISTGPRVTREQLIEMHSPILNECVELTKRASTELSSAKIGDGITSCERMIYLLERVAHAPPAMSTRIIQTIDESLKTVTVQESDRARIDSVKERALKLAAESGAR